MKLWISAALLAALASGCATTSGEADTDPPAGSNADKSDSAGGGETPAADAASEELTFGEAFTWDNGLTLKVGEPVAYTPSQYAATGKGPAVAITFTVVNKTDQPYDPGLFYATVQSGNQEAQEIFDSEKGLNGSPSTKVLPGREAKFVEGWNVKNPNDLVLEVSPDAGIEYESAIFTN